MIDEREWRKIVEALRRAGPLRSVIRELKARAVIALCEDGKATYDAIAEETGYSRRQVIRMASVAAGTASRDDSRGAP
jgi:hypothetical protein